MCMYNGRYKGKEKDNMITLSKQELEAIEKTEYQKLKTSMGSKQYEYCLGRWGMIRDLIDEMEESNGC